MTRKPGPAPTAYSYIRFSYIEQGKGDSVRRQLELRDAWLAKTGAVLDTSLSLRDEGVSAFTGAHRSNPDRHALAAFLDLVKRGRIPRGSYLIVESLDRLSREHIRPALTLLLNLIDAGIRVVQLLPVEAVYDESVEPMALMMAIMELSRGHSESQMKSVRVGKAWQDKREAAVNSKAPMTRRLPAWLRVEGASTDGGRVRGGRIVVIEHKAEIVRRIFRLAAEGHGTRLITKRLNREEVPPIGQGLVGPRSSDCWVETYVAKLLKCRSVLGEYQPHTRQRGKRRPEGPPIPDYYPRIISDEEWHAACAARALRTGKGGRPSPQVNLFSALLHDGLNGGRIIKINKGHVEQKGGGWMLVSYRAKNGVKGTKYVGYRLEVFETAVLSLLREVNPQDILPGNGAAERVLVLTGKHAEAEGQVAKIKAKLIAGGDCDDLADVLRAWVDKRDAAAAELAEAQRQVATPLSGAWGEYRSLVDILDAAPDPQDTRMRLRAVLRRMIEGIWCFFTAKGSVRFAAVQIHFAGGQRREYLIGHQTASRHCRERRWAGSLADAVEPGTLDLRKRAHARQLEQLLSTIDLDELTPPTSRKERRTRTRKGTAEV
jgi:DNA invertase Pin-like site-specific DNA recombinase